MDKIPSATTSNKTTLVHDENKVGKGAYGLVYKALDKQNNEYVAIKKVLIEIENEGLPSTSLREISLLREIEHKNVITYSLIVSQVERCGH